MVVVDVVMVVNVVVVIVVVAAAAVGGPVLVGLGTVVIVLAEVAAANHQIYTFLCTLHKNPCDNDPTIHSNNHDERESCTNKQRVEDGLG